jgi:hypothetical protein
MIYNRLIEIWRAPLVEDSYGRHRDWDNAARIASVPASFQPYRPLMWSHEDPLDRDTTNSRYKLYTRIVMDVEPTDRVLVDGEWWEIDGDPGIWDLPLNAANMKLNLRRITG